MDDSHVALVSLESRTHDHIFLVSSDGRFMSSGMLRLHENVLVLEFRLLIERLKQVCVLAVQDVIMEE